MHHNYTTTNTVSKGQDDLVVYFYPKLELSIKLSLRSPYFPSSVLCDTVVTSHIWLSKLILKLNKNKNLFTISLATFQVLK